MCGKHPPEGSTSWLLPMVAMTPIDSPISTNSRNCKLRTSATRFLNIHDNFLELSNPKHDYSVYDKGSNIKENNIKYLIVSIVSLNYVAVYLIIIP